MDGVELAEVLKTKALVTANLMALPNAAKEASKASQEIFNTYTELLLPKEEKSAKLKEMTVADKASARERLKEFKKLTDANLPKPKPRKHNRPN